MNKSETKEALRQLPMHRRILYYASSAKFWIYVTVWSRWILRQDVYYNYETEEFHNKAGKIL